MKAFNQYFSVELLIRMYQGILIFESVDEMPMYEYSNDRS